jgi:GDPmannose 4,6-dehydratase
VVVDNNLIRPNEVDALLANCSKAKKILKWEPKVSFDNLVIGMVESDLEFITNYEHKLK